jgi:hypothetical protein
MIYKGAATIHCNKLQSAIRAYAAQIDERAMWLIHQWRTNNSQLQASRCCVYAIFNFSSNNVQILETELKEGKNIIIMEVMNMNNQCSSYDMETRTISPNGGAVIIFAYGYMPTLVDLAHVKLVVNLSAANSMVSTRKNRTNCSSVGGCSVGFLEKSLMDWWGKYVLVIS